MSRLLSIAVVVGLALTINRPTWSQFPMYGEFFPSPQAGANTARSAGANTAAIAGPSGYYGTVQQVPGQYLPNGQFVPIAQPTPLGGAYRFSQIFGAIAPNYLISPT